MTNLIKQVAEKFNGTIIGNDTIKFSFGEDDYCLTNGTIYATLEDGTLLPGCKKVKGILAVECFVSERAED